ncbi:MAG TPA: hydrogenase [Geobacter sp.]|nr:hydrogenase [Geobacter sp.]
MGSVVEINPLTRVEGHGSVKVYREGSRVERVDLCLTESPRLFEALLIGKSYAEVPEIICRICSLCSTVHKVTALLAVEDAFQVEVSEVTALTRELMVQGGQIQDHALHLYCLLLPDLLGVRGVGELALKAPELLKTGLAMRKAGNMIQETVGGRIIHPVNIIPGGLGRRIGKEQLLLLRSELEAILPSCKEAFRLFRTPFPFPELPKPHCMALAPSAAVPAARRLVFCDGHSFPVSDYRDEICEEVIPHSHAKRARVLGADPTVGALARLTLQPCPAAGADEMLRSAREEIIGKDIRGNNVAQAIELWQAVARALELIDRLVELGAKGGGNVKILPRRGRGSAACEAPRGVLIHSYDFDQEGICTGADVITPTSLNQGALARDLLALGRGMDAEDDLRLTTAMERLVRCYDPCISCSVHLLRL